MPLLNPCGLADCDPPVGMGIIPKAVLFLAGILALQVQTVPMLAQGANKDKFGTVDQESLKEIREILRAKNFGDHIQVLKDMGSAANGAYLEILRDPSAIPAEIDRILGLVADQTGDRSAFLPFTQKLVGHKDQGIRRNAAVLLGEIGGTKDAPLLVPLLSDQEIGVQYRAATALAKIGTEKELEAFDRRLAAKHPLNLPDVLDDIRECRDKLKKRLEENKKKD